MAHLRQFIKRVRDLVAGSVRETELLATGRLLSEVFARKRPIASLRDVEFKILSQWGDDGIIQWLVHALDFPRRTFIEFGVSDYRESNTRFLMMNDNWSGLVMDGSAANVSLIRNSEYFWKYDLQTRATFIDRDNINGLIAESGLADDLGILHIDLDGNDYWIWKCLTVTTPIIVILEYNAIFGPDRPVTVPYDAGFRRNHAHPSNLYWGAALPAFHHLACEKGYAFLGCNSAGNNAYFVRRDRLADPLREVTLAEGYVASAFRESRDSRGQLTYLRGDERLAAIRGMPVVNVVTGTTEVL